MDLETVLWCETHGKRCLNENWLWLWWSESITARESGLAWLARPGCSRARSEMACFQCFAPRREEESPAHGSAACTAYSETSVSQKQPLPLTTLLVQ